MDNILLKLKELIFRNHSNDLKIDNDLHHAEIQHFLEEQIAIQKNRVEIQREKMNLENENLYNDFFNYSTFCNQNIERLEKGFQNWYKRAKSEFDTKTKHLLQANHQEPILKLRDEFEKTVAIKKARLEKRVLSINTHHEKKQKKFKAKMEQLKLDQNEFLEKIAQDSEKKIEQIQAKVDEFYKTHKEFYDQKRATLNDDFVKTKQTYKQKVENLNQNLHTNNISLNKYESERLNLNFQYNKRFERLQNKASKHSFALKKLKTLLFFSNAFEQEKIINGANKTAKFANQSKLIIFFIVISLFTGVLYQSSYYSSQNWFGAILGSNIPIAFIALGETLVILTGGIDLSVGSMIGFGGTVYMSLTYVVGIHWFGALIVMFIALILIGGLSGFLISRLKIPPFIITLAGLLTLKGAITIILKGVPISSTTDPLLNFFSYNINGQFPVSILVLIVVSIVLIGFIKFSKFGRYVYAVGDNTRAAYYSGINSKMILNFVYLLSAVLAGFGAISTISQINSVSPQTGATLELDAITAVALGGTSFAGGKGGLVRTLIGWFSISLLINALNFWGVDSNYQFIAKGIVIVIALIIDRDFNITQRLKSYYYKALSHF